MKHCQLSYLAAGVMLLTGVAASGAAPDDIVSHIESTSASRVIQSPAIGALLMPGAPAASDTPSPADTDEQRQATTDISGAGSQTGRKINGYRVQVFSDNNARTAKNEARSKSRNISARFPQYRTYVLYNSPYWRLKVGDFRTQAEADEAAAELRKAFPAYSKEIRVVRDKITLN